MNPSDSKLEEIEAKIDECGASRKDQHWLIAKVKEQDREIAELRVERDWAQDAETLMSDCRKAAEARADKAEAELAERTLDLGGLHVEYNRVNEELSACKERVRGSLDLARIAIGHLEVLNQNIFGLTARYKALEAQEQSGEDGALEENEHFKNAVEKFCEEKQGQQNMSDKLEGFSTGWLAACAALAEVTGEKKELPKFKDIIGLFVDKPEQEKK